MSEWPQLGVVPHDGRAEVAVWAPLARTLAVQVGEQQHVLDRGGGGLFRGSIDGRAGDEYVLVIDGRRARPDPCSRSQPTGIRGPSAIVEPRAFDWTDSAWQGLALEELVIYELHVGTFSDAGTFDGVVEHLAELRELGVTAIELMPVATFPGERNWGYDGVYSSAPHPVYGGPRGLAQLVDAAHREGLGVILDVVYNHIGPGSEAITDFGPYFTDRHTTFWGDALDYDERGVREWAIQNAELWVRDYHVDGLRLDAVHAIFDDSEPHILVELAERVRAINPRALVISEMEARDLRPISEWGHDAQWADEFHHVLHVLLTGERDGYYGDYQPSVEALADQLERVTPERLVFCSQNHDQVGNRALGDRPPRDQLRIRACALLLAPQVPLLFMGEEYGEQRPFQFFTDHIDPAIAEATREGRKREFEAFAAFKGGQVPDPQDRATFERSKLDRSRADPELLELYRRLIAMRRTLPRRVIVAADERARTLHLQRGEVEVTLDFGGRRSP